MRQARRCSGDRQLEDLDERDSNLEEECGEVLREFFRERRMHDDDDAGAKDFCGGDVRRARVEKSRRKPDR